MYCILQARLNVLDRVHLKNDISFDLQPPFLVRDTGCKHPSRHGGKTWIVKLDHVEGI